MNDTSNLPATAPKPAPSLLSKFANRFGVEPGKMLSTLKQTAFRQRQGGVEISNEQMMALIVVADQYGLNPFTKEIFAFEDKGAIIPVVSVDGWARIINTNPAYDGVEFRYSENFIAIDGKHKPCPEWCEAVIYRKDRSRPTIIREYLDEVYVGPRGAGGGYSGPWQTHCKRMLRHKTLIQGSRIAFGFAGIYDEDEAHRIIEGTATDVTDRGGTRVTDASNVKRLQHALESGSARAQTTAADATPNDAPANTGPHNDPFTDAEEAGAGDDSLNASEN